MDTKNQNVEIDGSQWTVFPKSKTLVKFLWVMLIRGALYMCG